MGDNFGKNVFGCVLLSFNWRPTWDHGLYDLSVVVDAMVDVIECRFPSKV